MSSRQDLDKLMKRVRGIEEATGSGKSKNSLDNNEDGADAFILLKREICQLERDTRNDIKARDEFAENSATRDQKAEIVKQTTAIKGKVKELRSKAAELRNMYETEVSDMKKKGKTSDGLENRKKMCDLIDARIDEVERYAKGLKFVSAADDETKRALLKGANFEATESPQLATFVPGPTESQYEEIDGIDEWRMQVQANEQQIDEQLDTLVEATSALVQTAQMLRDEYRVLGVMTDEVDQKIDKTDKKLQDTNEQLKKTIDKLGGGANCCLDIFLILVIIACVYFIITQFLLK